MSSVKPKLLVLLEGRWSEHDFSNIGDVVPTDLFDVYYVSVNCDFDTEEAVRYVSGVIERYMPDIVLACGESLGKEVGAGRFSVEEKPVVGMEHSKAVSRAERDGVRQYLVTYTRQPRT